MTLGACNKDKQGNPVSTGSVEIPQDAKTASLQPTPKVEVKLASQKAETQKTIVLPCNATEIAARVQQKYFANSTYVCLVDEIQESCMAHDGYIGTCLYESIVQEFVPLLTPPTHIGATDKTGFYVAPCLYAFEQKVDEMVERRADEIWWQYRKNVWDRFGETDGEWKKSKPSKPRSIRDVRCP